MIYKKFTRKTREVVDSTFLESSLQDILYGSPSFTIEEEQGTIMKYKKTKISFHSLHGMSEWSWHAPEIDSVNLLDLESQAKNLFSLLKESGFESPYVNFFSQCEKANQPYLDPEFGCVLIKRYAITRMQNGEKITHFQYHLEGGNLQFHRILEKDPNFWKAIVLACKQTSLVKISEVHIAADCNNNLMCLISNSIKKGHYEAPNLRVYGYYTLGGKELSGRIGKRSSKFRTLKHKDFLLHSLYFGNHRYEPFSFVFYDKELEQSVRHDAISNCKTRIEIRLNSLIPDGIPKGLLENIVASYIHPEGTGFRLKLFLYLLSTHIRFSTKFNSPDPEDIAPWWKYQVLKPLFHASLNMFGPEIKGYVSGHETLEPVGFLSEPKRVRGRPRGSKDKIKRQPRGSKKRLNGLS